MRKILLLLVFSFPFIAATAQSARDFIRMGNKAYREKQYDKAETMYLKSIAKNPTFEGYYNLGNAYVMQLKDSTAFANYMKADSIGTNDPMRKARNFHNMGNIWYAQGMAASRQQGGNAVAAFQRAVDFYKSSLRCNPNDDETRYNLAMAQHQLKKNQDQQKKDEDKQQQQQQQQPQPQQKKDDMSDQAAEQLLNSAQQDEKGVQRKVNKNQNNRRRSLEKDW